MIDEEQCIPTGDCFCGQPQGQARARVIPIRAEGSSGRASLKGHCERAGFDTVISVPVRLQERMVGELNLFCRTATQLLPDDQAPGMPAHDQGLRIGATPVDCLNAPHRMGFGAKALAGCPAADAVIGDGVPG